MTTGIDDYNTTLAGLGLSRPDTEKKRGDELGADQFMELMLAQMRNQDPLKPMENGDFIAQLAQFSSVGSLKELQTSFSTLATSMQSNQALQASTLVGRTVAIPGDALVLQQGKTVEASATVPSSTNRLTVGIYDQSGQLVRRLELGMQAAGEVPFRWDGRDAEGFPVAAGTYQAKAEATIDNKQVALNTTVYAQVQSVDLNVPGAGIRLNLAGLDAVNLSDVKQVM